MGLITFTTTLTSFLLALTFEAYGLAEVNTVYILLLISAVSLAAFIGYERRVEHPVLDLRLLGIREFTGGVIAQLLNAAAWGAVLLLLSFYLQIVLGLSAFDAGIRLIPFEIVGLVVGMTSGKLSDKIRPLALHYGWTRHHQPVPLPLLHSWGDDAFLSGACVYDHLRRWHGALRLSEHQLYNGVGPIR